MATCGRIAVEQKCEHIRKGLIVANYINDVVSWGKDINDESTNNL